MGKVQGWNVGDNCDEQERIKSTREKTGQGESRTMQCPGRRAWRDLRTPDCPGDTEDGH